MQVSYFEIYKEKVYDLLSGTSGHTPGRTRHKVNTDVYTHVCATSLLELDKNAEYLPKTFCIDNSLAVTASGNLLTFYFFVGAAAS